MGHVTGQSRYQSTLFPEVLDEVVSVDDPVRVIDAFVEMLDLTALGFSKVAAEEMGRPPYARNVSIFDGLPVRFANSVRLRSGPKRGPVSLNS